MNILVVDDQAMIRQIHCKLLTDAGHSVQSAVNGADALDIFHKFQGNSPFDMIMTDEEMPKMTGLELCEILYKEEPGLPIIMISSMEDMELMRKLMRMGIIFFRKPLRDVDLYPYLENLELQIKSRNELAKKASDHLVVKKYLNSYGFSLILDNDMSVHNQVMKYIIDFCQEHGIGEDVNFRIHFGLTETLTNAVAHGNLDIGSAEFKKDGNFAKWEAEILHRAASEPYAKRQVKVAVEVNPEQQATITVADEGKGFDHKKVLEKITPDDIYQAFGRGLVMLKNMADELIFNDSGNSVTMIFRTER